MPRNTRANAEASARDVLASAIAAYEKAHPAPRTAEADAVLKSLRALSEAIKSRRNFPVDPDNMKAARAFLDIYNIFKPDPEHHIPSDVTLLDILVESRRVKNEGLGEKEDLATVETAWATLPALAAFVDMLRRRGPSIDPNVDDGKFDFYRADELKGYLNHLSFALNVEHQFIEGRVARLSPSHSHRESDALRFLISRLRFYCKSKPSNPDIAKIASLALGIEVTDRMVSAMWK
jgi:hypothetical protein